MLLKFLIGRRTDSTAKRQSATRRVHLRKAWRTPTIHRDMCCMPFVRNTVDAKLPLDYTIVALDIAMTQRIHAEHGCLRPHGKRALP